MRKRSEAKLVNHIHLRNSGVKPPSPYAFRDWLMDSFTSTKYRKEKKRVAEVLIAKEFLVLFSSFGSSFQTQIDRVLWPRCRQCYTEYNEKDLS